MRYDIAGYERIGKPRRGKEGWLWKLYGFFTAVKQVECFSCWELYKKEHGSVMFALHPTQFF